MATSNRVSAHMQQWVLRSEHQEDIVLQGQMCIGRDAECDICIPDHRISRKHAKLSITPSGVLVEDLGSANGTVVNGQKIEQPTTFGSGARIRFHNLEFALINVAPKNTENLLLRSNQLDDIELRGQLSVGRDLACDICIPDHRISRRHAKITVTLSGVLVEDLNSTNGTFVNDQKITQPTLIKAGDRLRFHEREFRVEKDIDPNATVICTSEVDADATICAGVIVKGPQPGVTSTKAASAKKARAEVGSSEANSSESVEPKTPQSQTADENKLSAIQRQLTRSHQRPDAEVRQLSVGMWVEFKNNEGKNDIYCLVSIADSGDQIYCFVSRRGLSLIKKERQEVAAALNDGSLRIINKAPMLASALAPIKGALLRVKK